MEDLCTVGYHSRSYFFSLEYQKASRTINQDEVVLPKVYKFQTRLYLTIATLSTLTTTNINLLVDHLCINSEFEIITMQCKNKSVLQTH